MIREKLHTLLGPVDFRKTSTFEIEKPKSRKTIDLWRVANAWSFPAIYGPQKNTETFTNHQCLSSMFVLFTLLETNIFAPENQWLEHEFPFGMGG